MDDIMRSSHHYRQCYRMTQNPQRKILCTAVHLVSNERCFVALAVSVLSCEGVSNPITRLLEQRWLLYLITIALPYQYYTNTNMSNTNTHTHTNAFRYHTNPLIHLLEQPERLHTTPQMCNRVQTLHCRGTVAAKCLSERPPQKCGWLGFFSIF